MTLDGLRGIAALAVVTRHAPTFFNSISIHVPFRNGSDTAVGPFFESYLAVDFFFVLSGFVLAHAYGDRLRLGMSPSRFMVIRIVRLYPLYFFALLVSLIVAQRQWAYGKISAISILGELVFALLFLPQPISVVLFPLNAPAWSLFYELLANAIFGITGKHLKTPFLLTAIGIAGTILLFAVTLNWWGFGSSGIGAMAEGFDWHGFGAGMARVSYSFFAGILVFRAWKYWHPSINIPPLVIVAALGAVLVSYPPPQFQVAFDLLATLFVFPCLIFLGASAKPASFLARCFTWLGIASYAVYVLQVPLYEFVLLGVIKLSGGNLAEPPWTWGVTFVALTFGVAVLCDRYVDRPIRAIATRLLLKKADKTTA